MIKISPSVIAGDLADLKNVLKGLEEAGTDYIHIDVMDANFVPNLTIGPLVIKAMRPHTDKVFDVHLMMKDPGKYIGDYIEAGADIVGIHHEIDSDKIEILKKIRSMGCRAEIVLNPDTDIDVLKEYLPYVDQILLMSVFPGFSGQKFIETAYDRGRKARELIEASGFPVDLEVDGGVSEENCKKLAESGYNVFVTGSTLFRSKDWGETIRRLKGN